MKKATLFALLLSCLEGCASHFSRVDFKYDSNAHLRPADTMVKLTATPAEALERVRAFAAQNGGTVTKSGPDRPPRRIEFPADADEIWQAKRALFEAEWHAFDKDDPPSYFALDRKAPLLQRHVLEVKHDGVVESLSARIEFPARQAQRKIERGLGPVIPVWWTEVHNVDIKPVLYAFIWRGADGVTWVYARATPRIDNVEAGAPKAWCDYQLWKASTGYQEAMLVRELLEALTR
jgi:hypothetical protein